MAKHPRPITATAADFLPFSHRELDAAFDAGTLKRGRQYQQSGAVRDLDVLEGDPFTIIATVQGTEPDPYEVEITIRASGGRRSPGMRIDSECSCPVGCNCKHAAATLFEMLDEAAEMADALNQLGPERFLSLAAADVTTTGRGGGAAGKQTAPAQPAAPKAPSPLDLWLNDLAGAIHSAAGAPAGEQILYIIDAADDGRGRSRLLLRTVAARPLKAGGWGADRPYNLHTLATSTARMVTPADRAVGRLVGASYGHETALSDDPVTVDLTMRQLLGTGRARWRSKDGVVLTVGPARPGRVEWRLTPVGTQVPGFAAEEDGLVALTAASPWYVDPQSGACGPLTIPGPASLAPLLLRAPPLEPADAAAMADALRRRLPDLPLPPPRQDVVQREVKDPPVPCLTLFTHELPPSYSYRGGPSKLNAIDAARLTFDYGGTRVAFDSPQKEFREVQDGTVTVRRRRKDAERKATDLLSHYDLIPTDPSSMRTPGMYWLPDALRNTLRLADDAPGAWPDFLHRVVPELRAAGWRVEIDPSFRHRLVVSDGDWEARLDERGAEDDGDHAGWWFSLDLGIEVEGQRVPLLPVLVDALRRLKDATAPGALDQLAVNGTLYGTLPDGRTVALPFERVRAVLGVLVELFDAGTLGGNGSLDVSLAQINGLEAIAEATRLRWIGGQRLRNLAESLRRSGGVAALPPPAGLRATLRPYQQEGYSWLQFLARHGLGGVLADDMGLGKTLQTLAHLQAEKEAGRLDAPALVICPTSLVPNWQSEAARFTPALRVLILHGPARAEAFAEVKDADLVITTYPLLVRDAEALTAVDWQSVVLDEAQAIKNPAAKATQVACRLKAGNRLCLSGTPVENHLGEAWSQFAFLMPGLLGDAKTFTRHFRTPIEKRQDGERRQLLARRLKPFVLRRTKAEVAADLPPKTEIVRRLELSGDQRDLYETLRLAMHEKVRKEIAAKGLARSHILILDALLKLRQACCDPRLVKLPRARKTQGSAKLDHLMEMLPSMVEDGRRVLLFSQFTSMLDLIKPELDKAAIPFVELTGDTVDRRAPVQTFQDGRVPVFLISLKAGGVGLNLTAADTVIHYDPWWNPAVEDQATDRAHRIGQDKPVFVYKLIAAGTVEERMLDLQDRKRDLAGAMFDTEAAGKVGFDETDLDLLFQPLA